MIDHSNGSTHLGGPHWGVWLHRTETLLLKAPRHQQPTRLPLATTALVNVALNHVHAAVNAGRRRETFASVQYAWWETWTRPAVSQNEPYIDTKTRPFLSAWVVAT